MQAEIEALHQSDLVHRLLADNSVDMISRHSADGTVLYVTPACKLITGYTVEELTGKPVEHIVLPEDIERVWSVIQAAQVSKDSSYRVEHRLATKEGAVGWVETMGRLVYDGEGRLCEIQCHVRDITKRRRAEEALRESEERHRILFLQCKDAVMTLDPRTGTFTSANPSIADMFGAKDPEEFTSLHPWNVSPERQPDGQRSSEKARIMIETAMREGSHYFEWTHRRLDGAEFAAMVTLSRMQIGGQVFLHSVVRDISQQKEAEEALRQSEDRYRSIVSSMSDLIFVMDEEDRIIDVHCQSPEALMMPPEAFLGKTMAAVMPDDVHELYRDCVNRLRQTGENRRYEYSLPIHGQTRWFVASLDLHSDRRRIVAGVREITERRRAEEALKKAHDELEQRVKERTAELSKANARLRHNRRTLEHMLRASDHERQLIAYDIHDGLAQELAGAIMQFQIYEQQKDMQPENAQKTFDGGMTLLRQSHRETRRLISGVRPPILDESGVLAAIAHLIHDPALKGGPKVDFRSRVTFHRLEPVAENVIYRIVQEGLSNARTHSQSDKIRVSIVERGNRLRIGVRDWGIGFDPQDLQESRFGLEGIRERARLLGGKCHIRSASGRGTAVVVEIPIVLPQETPP